MRSPRNIDGVDYQMQENFILCDGAVLVVQVGLNNSDAFNRIFGSVARNSVFPLVFLDLTIIKSQLRRENYKKVQALINQTLEQINVNFRVALERNSTSFQLQDIIKLENLTIGFIDQGWAFSLDQFIQLLKSSQKQIKQPFSQEKSQQNNRKYSFLSQIYQPSKKQWRKRDINQEKSTETIQILQILCQLQQISSSKFNQHKSKQFEERLQQKFRYKLRESQNKHKQLPYSYQYFMRKKFPISKIIQSSIIRLISSPIQNQKFKVRSFYLGNQKDQMAQHIRKSDPKGPFIAYISKFELFPQNSSMNYWLLFGRVLSGTYKHEQKLSIVRLQRCQFKKNQKIDKKIRVQSLMGRRTIQPSNLCVGNIILSDQIHGYNEKKFIVMDSQFNTQSYNFNFNFLQIKVQNTVKMNIAPIIPMNLPKVVQQTRQINRKYTDVRIQTEDTGLIFMKSSSPYSLSECYNIINQNVQMIKTQIQIIYKQAITSQSSKMVMTKSQNKHNRIYGVATPIQEQSLRLLKFLNEDYVKNNDQRKKIFLQQSKWDISKKGQIWDFGPDFLKQNILTNSIGPVSNPLKTHIFQIKQSVISGFIWSTKCGVLCQQNVCGVNYSIMDCQLMSDAIHRGGGQIIPTIRRLFYASTLLANPILLQPIQKYTLLIRQKQLQPFVDLCKSNKIVYQQHKIKQQNLVQGLNIFDIEVPFTNNNTTLFNKCYNIKKIETLWQPTPGLALEPGTKTSQIVTQVRRKKGLNINFPHLNDYMDKF